MPELAEVEYYRKRWDAGVGARITRVALHGKQRVFRGSSAEDLARTLRGSTLLGSETRGKQMLFRFSKNGWLGVHLGMTGHLHVEAEDFAPGRHDHLVLFQKGRALVFTDARMFGRVRFYHGKDAPPWWQALPPEVASKEFTLAYLRAIFARRRRAPLKALLLQQNLFPGVGNWMADEILWQARLHPATTPADLSEPKFREFWRLARTVCRTSLKTIGVDWGDPPDGWLLHERFKKIGHCPRHGTELRRTTISGRTTAWCERCQPPPKPAAHRKKSKS
jgi:formamidopyrimidine-DNA glycosylase